MLSRIITAVVLIAIFALAWWLDHAIFYDPPACIPLLITLTTMEALKEWGELHAGRFFWSLAGGAYLLWAAGVTYVLYLDHPNILLWLVGCVAATDTGGYLYGKFLKPHAAPSHQLTPLSPNKTWEGLVSGMLLALAFSSVFAEFYQLPPYLQTWYAIPLAVISQGGDVLESWRKRVAGVKNSGNILPGHGGVLDRIDGHVSILVTAGLLLAPQIS